MIGAPAMTEITLLLRSDGAQRQGNGYAQGYGWFNVAYSIGVLLGPLISAFIVEKWSWTILCSVMGTMAGVTILPVLLFTGGKSSVDMNDTENQTHA